MVVSTLVAAIDEVVNTRLVAGADSRGVADVGGSLTVGSSEAQLAAISTNAPATARLRYATTFGRSLLRHGSHRLPEQRAERGIA